MQEVKKYVIIKYLQLDWYGYVNMKINTWSKVKLMSPLDGYKHKGFFGFLYLFVFC